MKIVKILKSSLIRQSSCDAVSSNALWTHHGDLVEPVRYMSRLTELAELPCSGHYFVVISPVVTYTGDIMKFTEQCHTKLDYILMSLQQITSRLAKWSFKWQTLRVQFMAHLEQDQKCVRLDTFSPALPLQGLGLVACTANTERAVLLEFPFLRDTEYKDYSQDGHNAKKRSRMRNNGD